MQVRLHGEITDIRTLLPECIVDQAQLIHDPTFLFNDDEKSVAVLKAQLQQCSIAVIIFAKIICKAVFILIFSISLVPNL